MAEICFKGEVSLVRCKESIWGPESRLPERAKSPSNPAFLSKSGPYLSASQQKPGPLSQTSEAVRMARKRSARRPSLPKHPRHPFFFSKAGSGVSSVSLSARGVSFRLFELKVKGDSRQRAFFLLARLKVDAEG